MNAILLDILEAGRCSLIVRVYHKNLIRIKGVIPEHFVSTLV